MKRRNFPLVNSATQLIVPMVGLPPATPGQWIALSCRRIDETIVSVNTAAVSRNFPACRGLRLGTEAFVIA